MNDPKGSMWRKWDLHLHTPETKINSKGYETIDGIDKWSRYCDILENSEVSVFGITDYFSVDNYFKFTSIFKTKYPNSKKVFFPNIEFRLDVSVNKTAEEVNIHVVFSDNISAEKINTFLSKLDTNITKEEAAKTCDKLEKSNNDFIKAGIKYSDIRPALKKVFGKNKCYLIFAASNNQGLRADTKSLRKLNITDEIDKICDGFYGGNQNVNYFLNSKRYEKSEDGTRDTAKRCPVVFGSDAHSFLDLENKLGKTYEKLDKSGKVCDSSQVTWIKADKTFEGLKQILIEPEERVFIGEKPESLYRAEQNPTKYINELVINKIDTSMLDEDWFENLLPIPLNNDLVAIIGNKGNGKSAIADIIGLVGNTQNSDGFSFLNDKKFRKKRPNRAEYFTASIKWKDGTQDGPKLLSEECNNSLSEKVKYIPQSYLETLCTETDEKKFSKELKKVIFSHVDDSEKLGEYSLDELVEYKSEEINKGIQRLHNELSEINRKIEGLEVKRTPEYRDKIEDVLKLKKEEHEAHNKNKPTIINEPKKDDSVKKAQKKVNKDIEELKKTLKSIDDKISIKKENRISLAFKLAKLQKFDQSLINFKQQYNNLKEQYEDELSEYGINFEEIVKLTIRKKIIDNIIDDIKKEIKQIDNQLNEKIEGSLTFEKIRNDNRIKVLQGKLDEPTRKFQQYNDVLKAWNEKEKEIIGTDDKQGTIKFYEKILRYLDNELNPDLLRKTDERIIIVKSIYTEKIKIVNLYKELYNPVTEFISEYAELMQDYNICLDVSIQLDNFHEKFFGYISRGAKGSFIGSDEGYNVLDQITEGVNFNSEEEVLNFLTEIIEHLVEDKRSLKKNEKRALIDQMKDGFEPKDFYNFLFGLDYLKPNYKLRLGTKEISELSPGERGALLLIFYLLLDKQDIPLIIDQPEENLDNQSVYRILVKFIKEAKKKRQIIIVTHNPNLAVVCDAEQIIWVKIDKAKKNKVAIFSGAIENPQINEKVVEILEGTFPAFDNRTAKYKVSKR